ncbi:type IV pilin protein [Leucothrix arctica]|uniref:Prepilin-type cleavage/methylation domain-containing protein n=1 Tax=Leucothrix arctica TaxID=1481894 RepID=A0A317CR82_9GAMM|nr:type IV pilin protein [Leucothrix arctica]PWQ98930.1 prepilin-type cleavage/methylation domain-containing protein [Leucothrix arctica]
MNNKNKGFSLIELMITVAILGILSAITVPSYMKYVQKTKRTEAKAEVLRLAQLQESYYVQNLSYAVATNGTGGLGFTGATVTTETGLYTASVQGYGADGTTTCSGDSVTPCVSYIVEALVVSTASQSQDTACANGFRLSNTGAKQARSSSDTAWTSTAARDECWN